LIRRNLRTIGVDWYGPAIDHTDQSLTILKDTTLSTRQERIRRMLSRIKAKESILVTRVCESNPNTLIGEEVTVKEVKGFS